ncbi:MAG: FAD-binding oxidoreductase [Sphingomicrobium sp.]
METLPASDATRSGTDIAQILRALLGDEQVETALDKRTFFSTDLSKQGEVAAAVIRPTEVGALAEAVKLCTSKGLSVVPRGGGFSYTGGYLPTSTDSVIVDLRGFDQIIEINDTDMYVVVGAGVTWHDLYHALKAKGLRTPYFGPMSGYGATVGGALSQGSFFLGSSQYGPVAESVLAIEVVLADGSVVRTGSWGGGDGASPFFRNFGPDFTGMFLSDTGAFGLKTTAVLKLIPFPAHQAFASFLFAEEQHAIAAIRAVGRLGIAAECYCWDPYFVKTMATVTTGLAEELKIFANVARGGGSVFGGLKNAAKLAIAGKRAFEAGELYMLNLTVDDPTRAGADARMALLKSLASDGGGREMTASAPMAMRGTPFLEFNTRERRSALRSLPTHGLFPHSKVADVAVEVRALLATHAPAMAKHGVSCGIIYFGVGAQTSCIEPVFYWEDNQYFHHDRVEERSDLAKIEGAAPAATSLSIAIRKDLVELFTRHGSAHVQIAKSYPWLATRSPTLRALAEGWKATVDPERRMNPGSLGL